MKTQTLRRSAWAGLLLVALLSSVPALSASSAGAFELTAVGDPGSPFVSGTADVQWDWQAGTAVRYSSVTIMEGINTTTGRRELFAGRHVRYGAYSWDTTRAPDGVYSLTARVRGTSVSSTLSPIYVDNTAPTARITRPARGSNSIYVQDKELGFDKTVVAGATTLVAATDDNFSGVRSVTWSLDGEGITLNEGGQYDFSNVAPGEHTLSVVATDMAGNRSEINAQSEIPIVVVGLGAGIPDLGEPPVDPNDPQLPVDPNDPQLPVDPNDPQLPVDPNDPQLPVDPNDPGDPPVDPNDPGDPPVNPNDPGTAPDPSTLIPVPPPSV